MSLTKIALVGANGVLGPHILSALQSHPSHFTTISVLTRQSSKSTYPPSTNVITIPDSPTHTDLVAALTGHHALIISTSATNASLSLQYIHAAHAAHLHRIIPADFGSCDSSDPRTLSLVPLYAAKKQVRDVCESLSRSTPTFTWTSVICGHFFDYDFGLASGMMFIDLEAGRTTVFDGGDVKCSVSMLRTVAQATVKILLNPDATANQLVYVQSASVTQNEILSVVERVTGRVLAVEHKESEGYIAEQKGLRDQGVQSATHHLVSVEGIVNGDWTGRKPFVNGLLGLPEEDLEGMVRESLRDMEEKKKQKKEEAK